MPADCLSKWALALASETNLVVVHRPNRSSFVVPEKISVECVKVSEGCVPSAVLEG